MHSRICIHIDRSIDCKECIYIYMYVCMYVYIYIHMVRHPTTATLGKASAQKALPGAPMRETPSASSRSFFLTVEGVYVAFFL